MQEWWNNLVLREKQALLTGGVCLSLAIFYFIIWSPLSTSVSALRTQIKRNHSLLLWMQDADIRIQTQQKTGHPSATPRSTGSLLSIVQNQINRTQLVSVMTQLHQIDTDSVQLVFQKVDFDKLIVWLTQLTQQQNLSITQMSITPSDTPGIVAADFVLKS